MTHLHTHDQTSFAQLGVREEIVRALAEQGIEHAFAIQELTLPLALAGDDLIGQARTGMGKTFAFGIPLLHRVTGPGEPALNGTPRALVVVPTRELCLQVYDDLVGAAKHLQAGGGEAGPVRPLSVVAIYGGRPYEPQIEALQKGADVIVGTPGRLLDLAQQNHLQLGGLSVLVLDEADEMLDMGFREELEHILEGTPETRRTLMFSATVPKGIANLAARYQKDAERVRTEAENRQHIDIEYRALLVAPGDEENAIVNIVRHSDSEGALVFCTTRAAVNKLMSRMGNRGFPVVALSGELSQKERSNALQALRDGRARVCIATDVAARGLDLDNLGLVIHADLPRDPATLLHRSGRTGRAGRKGVSALIVAPKARRRVERLLNDAKIEANWGTPPSADEINALDDARLLADPSLTRPIHESERAMIDALISQHGAEQVAAAFLRKQREGRSAPEDLREVDVTPPKPRRERGEQGDWTERAPREKRGKTERKGFDDAVWVRLNVGRKKNAEARWILPVLCKAGGLSRDDIGAIRINPGDTHVELTSEAAARFFEALGHGATLEKGLRAEPLEERPSPGAVTRKMTARPTSPASRGRAGKTGPHAMTPATTATGRPLTSAGKPTTRKRPATFPARSPGRRKPSQDEAAPAAREPSPRTDYIQDDRKKPYKDKPKGDFQRDDRGGDKPAGKPHGKPYAKAGGKPGKPRTEGGWKPP